MFDTILIANRGEIACRVLQTAQRMGIACVAVYSDADCAAKHVAMADRAVRIGEPSPGESYLRGDIIIQAALDSGAQAIHPGYGFLSENPEFVEAVEAAGLTFIGPSPQAIRAMGLKHAAKDVMEKAGVPVVPGYHGADQDPAHLAWEAGKIGFPVMIKAVAGGGGKGMRLVDTPESFEDALNSAQSEARAAVGNDAVLIEKFVEKPRHIEMQVFGDGKRAVHLFERDCSLQRRHQKVIEEAPAPGMTDEMRAAMGAAAVRAAEAIGYKGAGTVEFIVDASKGLRPDRFWFMEMNTRLQVEHPVTEAITGVDLVEWQLRVASGEPLPCVQDDLSINGHAFEARLYAEDAANGFLPATGGLTHLRFPADARIDSGVRAGDEISPHYDPMIAKLTVHGVTRDQVLQKLSRALQACEISGVTTNLGFLGALTQHSGFASGDVDTGLIERDFSSLTQAPRPSVEDIALAGLAGLGMLDLKADAAGFALWAPLERSLTLQFGEERYALRLRCVSSDAFDVALEDHTVEARRVDGLWRLNGHRAPSVEVFGGKIAVFSQYGLFFDLLDPLAKSEATEQGANMVEAPMPGFVRSVFVKPGQEVRKGEPMFVLEAMKMEHMLTAPRDGALANIFIDDGAQVQAGQVLAEFEETE